MICHWGLFSLLSQKKVVYTAVFGNYDQVPGVNPKWDCDFICFTDNPYFVSHGWRIVIIQLNNEDPAQANRRYKMLPHKYLLNYECSLYVDGNIKIVTDPSPLFKKYLSNGTIAIPAHPLRNCTYVEAQSCIDSQLVNKVEVELQMKKYADQGFPAYYGLTANGTILRKHFDKNVIDIMESWWKEYCSGVKRDQLSLQYIIWTKNINIISMEEMAWTKNKYFTITLHRTKKHGSLAGWVVDYICCNRYKSNFYGVIYKAFKMMGKIQYLQKMCKK